MRKLGHIVVTVLLFAGLTFTMGACHKTKDTTVEIFVNNEIGSPIPGARVRLFGESSLDEGEIPNGEIILDDTRYSDAEGRVFFDYSDYYETGQAGFAVLSVEIEKQLPPPDEDLKLETIIKIEEQVNNVEVYVLK